METALSIYKRITFGIEQHRRQRLVVPTAGALSIRPTIYFLTPDFDRPSGGIRVIYRHVDILNVAGVPAAVLHYRRNFRATWFEHQTRITDLATVTIKRGDLLIVSEVDGDVITRLAPGTRHLIFNQNVHMTWNRGGERITHHYAGNPDLLGVMVVSAHNEEVLHHAFPSLPVYRVRLSIDPVVFRLGEAPRDRSIAYMPRRGGDDARSVLAILHARGALRDWEVRPLDRLSEAEVGDRLRQCRIFLSLSHQEGFGLPPAEAMACGAFVVGYHGFSGREYFLPVFSEPVQPGDILACARAVETTMRRDHANPEWCRMHGKKASEFVLREYSQERERADLVLLYEMLLSRASVLPKGAHDASADHHGVKVGA